MTTFLASFALRSLVILLLTAFAAAFYRQRSAAVVHRIWTLGLIGCLLVPIVTLLFPAWELAVLPTPAVPVARVTSVSSLASQPINAVNQAYPQTVQANTIHPKRTLPREASPPQILHQSGNQQNAFPSPIVLPIDTESRSANTQQINYSTN